MVFPTTERKDRRGDGSPPHLERERERGTEIEKVMGGKKWGSVWKRRKNE